MPTIPAFYINLDARPDRRTHFEAQLARAGIAAERFPATTPAQIDPADVMQAKTRGMSPGELACGRSHQRVWELLVERGLPGALVFEDDLLLSSGLRDLSETTNLHRRFDALHLEGRPTPVRLGAPTEAAGHSVRRLMSPCLGAGAYYLSTDLAARLLRRSDLDDYPVDKFLFGRRAGLIYDARIYKSVPALAVQLILYKASSSASRSDLTPDRLVNRRLRNDRPARSLGARLGAIRTGLGYWTEAIAAYGPNGDLFRSRRITIPPAPDIAAQL